MQTDIRTFFKRRTLIAGPVNTGKTARTRRILERMVDAGRAGDIAVLDLAPEIVAGVGGKMGAPGVRVFTTRIHAPRLSGRDAAETEALARENAREIASLFADVRAAARPILFVNDASLYLQAGNPDLLVELLAATETAVANCYYGDSFADSPLSRRERRRVERLMGAFDRVIRTDD